jgi:hypothetical protein
MRNITAMRRLVLSLLIGILASGQASASDARSYVLLPTGSVLTELRHVDGHSTLSGGKYDVTLESGVTTLKNTYYFDLLGNLAALQLNLPYASVSRSAGPSHASDQGLGDPSLLLGWGLWGSPALSKSEFSQHRPDGFSSAMSIQLTAPLGEYERSKPVNVGGNRQVQRYELQAAWRSGAWLLEFLGGLSHFGDNDKYLGNHRLAQKRLYHAESHASYNISRDFWVSVDSFYTEGGEYLLDGRGLKNAQRSFAGGGTAVYKTTAGQFVKLLFQRTINRSDVTPEFFGVALSYNWLW